MQTTFTGLTYHFSQLGNSDVSWEISEISGATVHLTVPINHTFPFWSSVQLPGLHPLLQSQENGKALNPQQSVTELTAAQRQTTSQPVAALHLPFTH